MNNINGKFLELKTTHYDCKRNIMDETFVALHTTTHRLGYIKM